MLGSLGEYAALPFGVARAIDVRQALVDFLAPLARLADDYALIGGVALAVYGIQRYTTNIDLAVTVAQAAAAEVARADYDNEPSGQK